MNLQLLIIAFSPALALIWFFSKFNREAAIGPWVTSLLFVGGGASGFLALMLNHLMEKYTLLWAGAPEFHHRLLFWLLGIGLNEESVKMLVVLLLLYPRRDFTTPYQGLQGAATVALGFAAVENVFYLERFGVVTLLIRSAITVPAHAFFTIPLGVCLAYAKLARGLPGKYWWMLGGLCASISLHGLYDVWLSLDADWVNRLAYVQVFAMGLMTLWLMRLKAPIGEQGRT